MAREMLWMDLLWGGGRGKGKEKGRRRYGGEEEGRGQEGGRGSGKRRKGGRKVDTNG